MRDASSRPTLVPPRLRLGGVVELCATNARIDFYCLAALATGDG